MNQKKTLWLCLVLAAGCAVLFGGCEAITALFGGGGENGGGGGEDPGNEPSFDPTIPSFYVSENGDDDDNDGMSEDTPFATLSKAYEAAKDDTTRRRIVVLSNLSQEEAVEFNSASDGFITIEGKDLITITDEKGNDKTIAKYTITRSVRQEDDKGSVLEITGSAKIKFVNIIVNGIVGDGSSIYNRAIKVDGVGSAVTLEKGAMITGKLTGEASGDKPGSNNQNGSGIFVTNDGTLTIAEGSEVTKCGWENKGYGAVYVDNGGSVLMTGGSINNNTPYRGAVALYQNSTFTMTGGEIRKNTSSNYGGGIYAYGKSGNETDSPTLALVGGNILNNTATAGAGIYALNTLAKFTIGSNEGDGPVISYNEAVFSGGGIEVSNAGENIEMKSGTISDNTVTSEEDGFGGGVTVSANLDNVTFTMSGGEISHNTATSGGGVSLFSNKADKKISFILSGGTIYGSNSDAEKANVSTTSGSAAIYQKASTAENKSTSVTIGQKLPETTSNIAKSWDETITKDYTGSPQ
ncbi:MAG: hypothetical protein LBK61_09890 [Spirochaetaceae bacterium]|jgi:hypothetical protein|nr:hypothetical protein [Spirochaetaceae bacterium]